MARYPKRLTAAQAGAAVVFGLGTTLGAAAAGADEVVWARYGDIDSLDPHRATSTLSMQVWDQIYDTLLAFDEDGVAQPHIAKDWTVSDDGLEYVFELEDGVLCHDGTPFDAHDVKYTIDRAMDPARPSVTKSAWGPIAGTEVVDDLTVKVVMATPFAAFLPFLADSFASIVCASNEEHGDAFGTTVAVGAGPFKLVEWARGDRVVLERNDDYRNFGKPVDNMGPPHVDRLVITAVPEPQTRLAALRTGEVHVAEPPLDDVPDIQAGGEFEIVIGENTGQNVFFQFAVSRPPFDDIRARQAVAMAVEPEMMLDIVYQGLSQRERCPVARGVLGNDQDFCAAHGYDYDPERAKELLAELGYGPDNPINAVMLGWTGAKRDKILEVFQAQLRQVGINASIEIMDIGTMNARVKAENETADGPATFDMMTWGWFDPDILYQLWHSPGAYSGYQTPELDAMLEKTRTTIDPEARLEAVREVTAHLLENAVHVPLYTPGWEWVFAVRPEVEGFKVGAFLHPMFNDVQIKQ